MAGGIRGLIAAATARDKPLDFRVELYCGQMVVGGQVAPPDWFHKVTINVFREEIRTALPKIRKESDEEKRLRLEAAVGPFAEVIAEASALTADSIDEVTLVNARVFPAVSTQGTQSGGRSIPVLRIPLSSISSWWIISGEAIKGRAGTQLGWGFLFPVGN
jgi:hypothetical protein